MTKDLAEVLALLERATAGKATGCMRKDGSTYISIGDPRRGPHAQGDVYLPHEDVDALCTALNFLRKHGPALLSRTPAVEDARDGERPRSVRGMPPFGQHGVPEQ